MDTSGNNSSKQMHRKTNQNIQVYVRVRPLNSRERCIRSAEVIDVVPPREIITRHTLDSKLTKKFTFDRTFGVDSRQVDVYTTVVAPLIEEVLSGYNCTVFAYGQTGTGKTHTMVGNECAELKSSWEDDSDIGIIPRALSHLFDELRLMEVEYTMRISYLELYNEELCDLLSTDDTTKIRIFDDSTKKGSVIIQGLEEIPVHSKDDVYKLLEKGKERRKTAQTLMNAQSSRSHTVFSIVVHIRENGIEGEEMLKIGKLNLVDLAGSENVSKAGNEKGIRVRETVNINQSLLTLGRVITALVERTPHIPYRESKLTRLLQESLGGRTKTSIIATISPGHKDIEETLSTLEYAHRAKNIQNKPEVNQKLTKKTVLKEYTEEIDKLKRDLMAARDKNGIYLAEETYNELTLKMDSQNRELNEKMLLLKALKDELANKEKIFNEVSLNLVEKAEELKRTEQNLAQTRGSLQMTKKVLSTTKRRYKEKKALLETHVKTEKELTTQATQILEVADQATNDTQQLHSTIERRKDVDQKIRTACESFSERMQENFEMLDGSLAQFQEQQATTTQMLDEELSNCSNVHARLLGNAEQRIENIKQICINSLLTNSQLHTKYADTMTTLNEEQLNMFTQIIGDFKKVVTKMSNDIQLNLTDLASIQLQQRSTINELQNKIVKTIETNTTDLAAHVKNMQEQQHKITALAENNFQVLTQLQAELGNENALNAQERKIIDDFVLQMQQIGELREKKCNNTSNLLDNINKHCMQTVKQVQHNIEIEQEFIKNSEQFNVAAKVDMEQHIESTLELVAQNVNKNEILKTQIEQYALESSKAMDCIETSKSAHYTRVQQLSEESGSQLKRMRVEQEKDIGKASGDLQIAIHDETQRVHGHVAIANNYIGEMKSQLDAYAHLQRQQVMDCSNIVEKFKQSELKTYSPTGATPSKRDFIYPRILAATSPHMDIVRRYRHEQDWSDLDTTIPIDECSEGELDAEPNSVREFSDTAEAILNSTPVAPVPESIAQKRGSFNNAQNSGNALRPPLNGARSSSLTRATTPRKTNSRLSPAINARNKENIA